MEETTLNPKIKANAVSAYLFMWLLFLFNKTNPYINNNFVRSHSKTAFVIHSMLLLVYIIFINLISNYYVHTYISSVLFLWVFWLMLLWIYKANKWEIFTIIDIVKIGKTEKIANLHQYAENDEKSKFSFFLSYIPFVSYVNYSLLNSNPTYNKVFKNNLYINLIISLIISIIYINWNINLALFLLLFYIIIITFISVILVSKDNLIFIHINHLNKIEDLELYLKTFAEYFKNYTKTHFTTFKELLTTNKAKATKQTLDEEDTLQAKNNSKLTNKLIYIPILNLIYLFSLDTKYRFHIINWLSLTIISIIMLFVYKWIDITFFLLLYPICFWIWNQRWKLAYKQTFTFHIYNSLVLLVNKFSNIKKKIKETKNTVKEIDFKIEWEIEVWPKKIIAEVKEWTIVKKEEPEI